jgi:hypothetical protein
VTAIPDRRDDSQGWRGSSGALRSTDRTTGPVTMGQRAASEDFSLALLSWSVKIPAATKPINPPSGQTITGANGGLPCRRRHHDHAKKPNSAARATSSPGTSFGGALEAMKGIMAHGCLFHSCPSSAHRNFEVRFEVIALVRKTLARKRGQFPPPWVKAGMDRLPEIRPRRSALKTSDRQALNDSPRDFFPTGWRHRTAASAQFGLFQCKQQVATTERFEVEPVR